jgi:5S rRNA maturation endonuclease (ribonuclease M5)
VKSHEQRKEALEELSSLLGDLHNYIDVILVEGQRDVESIKNLGGTTEIEMLSHKGVNDFDLANDLASRFENVLVLTDFDEEGLNLNKRFTVLLEHEGVRVESGLRLIVGKLMARIGVYAIEDLDNIKDETL